MKKENKYGFSSQKGVYIIMLWTILVIPLLIIASIIERKNANRAVRNYHEEKKRKGLT